MGINSKQNVVFFDVDNTLINGQSQKILGQYLYKNRIINLILYLKILILFIGYRCGIVNPLRAGKVFIKYFAGYKKEFVEELFKDFFEEKIKSRFYSQSLNLIKEHKRKGDKVILVSTAIEEIVNPIKEYLNIDYAISTQLECNEGIYTGEIKNSLMYKEKKLDAIKKFLQENNSTLEGSFYYTDHLSDLRILELVDNPIVINPDRLLRQIARQRKWKIYEFRRLN